MTTPIDKLSRQLLAPPATGKRALLYGMLLVAVPTVFRLLIDGFVNARLPFFAYIPFVVIAGAVLSWRGAALVALASWLVADYLFMWPRYQFSLGAPEAIGFCIFVLTAILIIGLVEGVRIIVENSLRPVRPDGFSAPVVFSLRQGQAWVSWYGSHSWVRLGPEDQVAEMMEDFLSQREIGRRLMRVVGDP